MTEDTTGFWENVAIVGAVMCFGVGFVFILYWGAVGGFWFIDQITAVPHLRDDVHSLTLYSVGLEQHVNKLEAACGVKTK